MIFISKKKVLSEFERQLHFYEESYKECAESANNPDIDEHIRRNYEEREKLEEASYWSLKLMYLYIKNCM